MAVSNKYDTAICIRGNWGCATVENISITVYVRAFIFIKRFLKVGYTCFVLFQRNQHKI